ncbi:hypothetical protein VMB_25860 [Vibrio mimicus VM603]|uniref:Uncharacterized protein n=2 Tax=Vibrio mimicus TaxID=674 RepID=D2YGD9_VIBMI|nr:hypothetical protein VMB_25860 [Vibrio mimicus VM603]
MVFEELRVKHPSNRHRKVIVFLLFSLLFLYSRAAIISCVVFYVIKYIGVRRFILYFLPILFLVLGYKAYDTLFSDDSFSSKIEIIKNTSEFFAFIDLNKVIFGGGAEFAINAFQIIGSDLGAHLLFVVIAVNYGLVGLVAYCAIVLWIGSKFSIFHFYIPITIVSFSMLPIGFPSYNMALALIILLSVNNDKKTRDNITGIKRECTN